MGHLGLAIDRFGPEQEDLRHDRGPGAIGRSRAGTRKKRAEPLRRAEAGVPLWTYGDPKKHRKAVEALDAELD